MRRLWAALIGVGAGIVVLGAYVGARRTGVHIPTELLVAAAAALAFAGAVAVFALLAMDRASFGGSAATLLLNERPATDYIFSFRGQGALQVAARPEMSVGEILVRSGDAFKSPPEQMDKPITLTLRGSTKKPFATITLQQLFLTLKPFQLQHVVLLNEKDDFMGYIPGKRALKEFAAEKSEEKITNFIVKVLAKPSESAGLREIGGVARDDTIEETENARHAEAKIWVNENVQGLVVQRHHKPIGYISKVDVLRLNAVRP